MSTSNLFVEIVPLNPRESSKSASMSTRKKLKSTIICILYMCRKYTVEKHIYFVLSGDAGERQGRQPDAGGRD